MLHFARRALSIGRQTPVLHEAWKKTSTGLVGLLVDQEARQNLAKLQDEILEKIKIIPEHTNYRKCIENTYRFRQGVVQNEELNDEQVEDAIGYGQLEELIEFGKEELDVIQMYHDTRLWERVEYLNSTTPDNKKPWEW